MRFSFERAVKCANREVFAAWSRMILLRNMRQFMHQKLASGRSSRCILIAAENDVVSHRVGRGVHGAGGCGGLLAGVNLNVTEIVLETRFHFGKGFGIERVSG